MKNILIFGDSNAWGYDVTTYMPELGACQRMNEKERWPGIVRTSLGEGYLVTEDALNARTLMVHDPWNANRHGITQLKVALDAQAPLDLVVLQMGCNELKHAFNLTAGMIGYGIEAMVRECKVSYYNYPAPKVLLIAPSPTHPDIGKMLFGYVFGPDAYKKSLELGPICKDIAERNGCGFIDCADLDFEVNTLDGLHYSKQDHAKLAPVVTAKIKEMIG